MKKLPTDFFEKLERLAGGLNGGKVNVNIEGELTVSSQGIFRGHQGVDSETQGCGTGFGYTILPPGIRPPHRAVDVVSAKSHSATAMLVHTLTSHPWIGHPQDQSPSTERETKND